MNLYIPPEDNNLKDKMSYRLTIITITFFLLFSIAFAQNQTDPCAGVTCNTPPSNTCADANKARTYPSTGTCANGQCTYSYTDTDCPAQTTTCPDGFAASCKGTCSNGVCSTCTPDCSQHQTAINATQPTNKCVGVTCEFSKMTCPDGYVQACPNYCDSNTGSCSKCAPDCSQHQATNATVQQCPIIQPMACKEGEEIKKKFDDKGCVIRYECYTPGQEICLQVITPAMDGAGNCKEFGNSCLPPGWRRVDRCPSPDEGKVYCGNGVCEIGEDYNNCQSDCQPQVKCPTSTQCSDGTTRRCYPVGTGCGCDPCGPPPGCREEKDATGFVRTICETKEAPKPVCPTIPQEVRLKCADQGGMPTFNKDPAGCDVFDCRFQGQAKETPVQVFRQYQCPTKEDWEATSRKCASLGMRTVTVVEGGCNFPRCVQEEHKEECGLVSGPERQRIEADCKSRGLGTVSQFDGNGCQRIECGQEFDCPRDLPKEAYMKCEQNGGEMIVKRDNRGCIAFTDCVIRGDDTKVFVEKVEKVPESTELLSVAFKLENLKIELDKLAKQTDEIADYYKSTGSGEENRFRRVSDMFEAAKGKVDEIKNKIRDRLKDITVDDMTEIRQDIKYIKDVMIKDIVYVMLSSSEDVQDIINSKPLDVAEKTDVNDCGTDGMCFDRAFRLCKQVSFRPEGRDGPIVKVMGLDGNVCVMKVTIPEDQGPPAGMIPGINPPYEMKCRIEKYALGVKNPDTDIIPFCEGNLKELMKYDKQRPEGTREGVGICGDTICDSFEQRNPQDCPQDCRPLLTQPAQRQIRYGPAVIESGSSEEKWYPPFERSRCENCLSNDISISGEPVKGKISLSIGEGRGDIRIVQYPEERNGFETIILFDDSAAGADIYDFKILDETGTKPLLHFRDCIDGRDYLIIKATAAGNTLKYRHLSFENPGEHQDCAHLLGGVSTSTQPAQRTQPVQTVQQVQTTASTCPVVNELQCPAGKVRVARSGSSGCIIGYDCVSG